jgi:hypothetical protein
VSLSERLEELAAAGTTVPALTHAPAGWEPGIRYEPDGTRTVTLPPSPALADEDSWAAAVRALGADIPDGYRVRLVEAKYDPAAWHRDESWTTVEGRAFPVKTQATTRPVWRYRFVVEPCPARVDVDELLRAVKARKRTPSAASGAATFVFACGDLQLGKPDGDGSAGTVERFYASLERALTRYKALRKRGHAGPVALLFGGDCPEGTQSQGGRLIARLDLTLTEQIRVLRRIIADEVGAFAALTDDLTVAACAGNHGEATRTGDQMSTRYDDSWDIEAIVQVADVMKAKGYDGIGWMFPGHDQMHVTLEASGTRIGLVHGHQARGKMQNWLANKALDRDPIGTCDVVVSGHHHTLRIEHLGPTTWMQTGALDGGSIWWNHKGGLSSPPAAITFVTESGKWNGMEVV